MKIHGIWHDAEFPSQDNFVESWRRLNPGAGVKIWTFAEGEELIARHHPELLDHYRSFPFLIQKANVLRMVVLDVMGGIYLDLDMECLRPLAQFFERDIFFGLHETAGVCNAILGSQAKHPFWKLAFAELLKFHPVIPVSSDGIRTAGAGLLARLIRDNHMESKCEPAAVFFPTPGGEGAAYTAHRSRFPRWLGKQYDRQGVLHTNTPWLIAA